MSFVEILVIIFWLSCIVIGSAIYLFNPFNLTIARRKTFDLVANVDSMQSSTWLNIEAKLSHSIVDLNYLLQTSSDIYELDRVRQIGYNFKDTAEEFAQLTDTSFMDRLSGYFFKYLASQAMPKYSKGEERKTILPVANYLKNAIEKYLVGVNSCSRELQYSSLTNMLLYLSLDNELKTDIDKKQAEILRDMLLKDLSNIVSTYHTNKSLDNISGLIPRWKKISMELEDAYLFTFVLSISRIERAFTLWFLAGNDIYPEPLEAAISAIEKFVASYQKGDVLAQAEAVAHLLTQEQKTNPSLRKKLPYIWQENKLVT